MNAKLKSTRRCAVVAFVALLGISCWNGPASKGDVCLSIGDYRNAITFYEQAILRDPGSFPARYGLALAWMQRCTALEFENKIDLSDWSAAVQCIQYARKITDSPRLLTQHSTALYKLAMSYETKGNMAGALQTSMYSMSLDPENIQRINYAAVLNYRIGNISTATDMFIRSSLMDSTDATACFNLGMIAWYAKDTLDAYNWWSKALKRAPLDTTIQQWYSKTAIALLGDLKKGSAGVVPPGKADKP